ncbi:hypothetical protein DV738_g4350, partial [Chaetothyriales sp. CBS 135597]
MEELKLSIRRAPAGMQPRQQQQHPSSPTRSRIASDGRDLQDLSAQYLRSFPVQQLRPSSIGGGKDQGPEASAGASENGGEGQIEDEEILLPTVVATRPDESRQVEQERRLTYDRLTGSGKSSRQRRTPPPCSASAPSRRLKHIVAGQNKPEIARRQFLTFSGEDKNNNDGDKNGDDDEKRGLGVPCSGFTYLGDTPGYGKSATMAAVIVATRLLEQAWADVDKSRHEKDERHLLPSDHDYQQPTDAANPSAHMRPVQGIVVFVVPTNLLLDLVAEWYKQVDMGTSKEPKFGVWVQSTTAGKETTVKVPAEGDCTIDLDLRSLQYLGEKGQIRLLIWSTIVHLLLHPGLILGPHTINITSYPHILAMWSLYP